MTSGGSGTKSRRLEPAKRESMLRAIRVVDIVVDTVEGQSKLNQHKIDEDHIAVANRLAGSETSAGRDLAARAKTAQFDAGQFDIGMDGITITEERAGRLKQDYTDRNTSEGSQYTLQQIDR